MRSLIFLIIFFANITSLYSQNYTRSDSLRGSLNSLRSCYDVYFYDLKVIINESEKRIETSSFNRIFFTATFNFTQIQIDLFKNMDIDKIVFENQLLSYHRESNAVFIDFPREIMKGEKIVLAVYYSGSPRTAINPPWDGGFSWKKDINGKSWIGVSCQGLGASSWWPCKDHQSEEPDSMMITISLLSNDRALDIVSNGNLIHDTLFRKDEDLFVNQSKWFVSYPINSYNVSVNIGDFHHFSDKFFGSSDTLKLDYYVLSYNKTKAIRHFEQVKPMLNCFEEFFGPYPFYNDGYALVETPYLGMEHQSGIAYGNNYLPGYYGDTSFIAGLDFDFIIVHESGHEWWGNSITTNDIADMWIHEGFCTYSEVLYVECIYGYETMLSFVNNQKKRIRNDKPIIGDYEVNNQPSTDMYNKGSLILHTLRSYINNDSLWFSIIRNLTTDFKYKTVDGSEIINYISKASNLDLENFFLQYLYTKDIPELQYRLQKTGREIVMMFRWNSIDRFSMPLLINTGHKDFWIYPNQKWQEITLGSFDISDFNIRDDLFLIDVKNIK